MATFVSITLRNVLKPIGSVFRESLRSQAISKTFTQLEDGLIATKMSLAQAEAEKEQMTSRVGELNEAVTKVICNLIVTMSHEP